MTSHPVSTAVIGAGDWGKNHVRKYHELGALAAIADTNPTTLQSMSNEFGVKALSFDDILQDDSIKAIALCTPATTHKELALKALSSNKNLFIEKPIALEYDDALAITKSANEKGLILMIGHLLHYHPCFDAMKQLVNSGELGQIRHIHARRFNIGKFREQENVIWDLGPHDASMVLSLTGCEPTNINASSSSYLLPTVSDFATIHLNFPNNVNAEINLSWLAPQKEHRLIVVGDKAMAVFDDTLEWEEKLRIHRHTASMEYGKPPLLEPDMAGEAINIPYKEPLLNECATFLSSIETNTQPYSNGEEACRVIKLLRAADPALKTKTTISKAS